MNLFSKVFGNKKPKVFVLGIDGAPPKYILDEWIDDLPNLKNLLSNSVYGELESTIPPSTIIAWTSMLTGKDPSYFDVYSYTYKDKDNKTKLTDSSCVKEKRIWKYLERHNKKSILLHVPLTYPVETVNGIMLGGFLTPGLNEKSYFPKKLKKEILKISNSYKFDVGVGLAGYKDLESDRMINEVNDMTVKQLTLTKNLMKKERWDFFMTVLIGSDRMQHTMWRFHDKSHRRYPGENKYQNSLKEYYQSIDSEIGEIKKLLNKEDYLIVVSDHGFDKMDGRFNLNDWLIREGYLVLNEEVESPKKLDFKNVDWQKTKAYAIGAYFGRIFFNKKSRDPENGIMEDFEIEKLQKELIEKLLKIKNDFGEEINNKFYLPQDVYSGPHLGNGPDLYVYFDDLRWGINNDVGNDGLYSERTTKGSDDAGHAPKGIFIIHNEKLGSIRRDDMKIIDVLPTIFNALKLDAPNDLKGKSLI